MENLCSIYRILVFIVFITGPDLSRSFKRPDVPRLPRMELVANGTRSSQTEIPNGNFPKFFVYGKRPKTLVAFQGGHLEKVLLNKLKNPKYNELLLPSCGYHLNDKIHHCPVTECSAFWRWYRFCV